MPAKNRPLGSMKVKRKVVKAAKDTSLCEYAATFGTPNQPGPVHEYVREAKAKERAIEVLNERRPLLARINPDGLQSIDAALSEIAAMPTLTHDPFVVTCVLDEDTGMTMQIRLWKK